MDIKNMKDYVSVARRQKFSLDLPHMTIEKQHHVSRMMKAGGLDNKIIILPIDHGLEHGPSDFLESPWAIDPEYQLQLAKEAQFSAVACHVGIAQKYWQKDEYRNSVPLILKLNGKTNIPSDEESFSGMVGTVEDALSLGADGVGYTLYVGSEMQAEDFAQFMEVRLEAQELGLPLIVWAYPRGEYVEEKGGKDSLEMISYAARVASEVGADFCKVNFPIKSDLELTEKEKLAWVVACAGNLGVLMSGGGKVSEKEILEKIRLGKEAEMDGFIFGRNIWQREFDEAMNLVSKIKEILK